MPEQSQDLPRHIAVIMDGNGRWALQRGKRRTAGHREGAKRVREITIECARLSISQLTLYALSVENYVRRPRSEIRTLMSLLRRYVIDERPTLAENNIRFTLVGRRAQLPDRVMAEVEETERLTAGNTGMVLCIAVNYGGRAEIADAARAIAQRVHSGALNADDVNEQTLADHLYTAGMPDVDLMIRTAGEMRISNFLLWQAWYGELYVTDVLWPNFDAVELGRAIDDYARRERKFGDVRPSANVQGL